MVTPRRLRSLNVGASVLGASMMLVAACSVFGAANEPPPEDAPSIGNADGSTTSSSGDSAAPIADASLSDGSSEEGSISSECPGQLCSTFDPPHDVAPFAWDTVGPDNADGRFDLIAGKTTPNALRIILPESETGVPSAFYLEKGIPSPITKVALSFEIRVASVAKDSDKNLRLLEIDCGGDTLILLKLTKSGKLQTGSDLHPNSVVGGGWQHVELSANFVASTVTASITGNSAVDAPINACTEAPLRLRFGGKGEDTQIGTWELAFDDVVFSWQ